jgi:hypothetical protein
LIEHIDPIHVADGGTPVGDDDYGDMALERVDAPLDGALGFRVQRAGGLFQNQ